MNMSETRPQLPAISRRGGGAAAFTLTEVLVVIGIIVLIAVLAVPSFRALTGGRSTEAAQNTISAVLARARTEALGLQQSRGVLFFRDLESGRIGMAMVRSDNEMQPHQLDLVPDRDPVMLPVGVGIQFIDDVVSPSPDPSADRYIGFNRRIDRTSDTTVTPTVVPYGGVVLFDRKGRLASDEYAFLIGYAGSQNNVPTEMGRFLYDEPQLDPTSPIPLVATPTTEVPISKLGFVLFDEDEFAGVFREGRAADTGEDPDFQYHSDVVFPGATNEEGEETWLSENGTPFLVNRYNGTLVRGE